MTQPTTEIQGLKAAKDLIANYPNAKLDNAGHFYTSLGRVLGQYPYGVVADCVDPVNGLARRHKWVPTLADVTEWCDERLRHYQIWSQFRPLPLPAPMREISEAERSKVGELLADLAKRLRVPSANSKSRPRYTDDELRALYPPRESISRETSAEEGIAF